MVSDGVIETPPLSDDVLAGVTRSAVMQLAHDLGYEVHVRKLDRTELLLADEVFLCGTGVQIAEVVSIDDRPVGDGRQLPGGQAPAGCLLRRRSAASIRGMPAG